MTMAVVHIDPKRRELTMWSAASPGLLVLSSGTFRSVLTPGRVLGDQGPVEIGKSVVRFEPGDRFLLSTDGLYELKDERNRQLGPRRVAQLMRDLADVAIDEIPSQLSNEIRETLKERPQEDDITCVVLEISDASRSPRANPDRRQESP
jgi:serine phosphatase RsbU (regulator of sigma subunit)